MQQRRRDILLVVLARADRTKIFLGVLALALLALLLPGVLGAVVIFALVAGLAWLQAATWAVTPPPIRAFRLAMVALFVVIAVLKLR